MENIYRPRVSEVTNVRKFFNDWSSCKEFLSVLPTKEAEINKLMGFEGNKLNFKQMVDSVNLDTHLSSINDIPKFKYDPNSVKYTKKTVQFETASLKLNRIQETIDTLSNLNETKRCRMYQNKYKYLTIENSDPPDLSVHEEVILSVRFHEPFKYVRGQRNFYHPKFRQEFRVLGSNFLTELRDKIYCQCNLGPFVDVSDDPFTKNSQELVDSGFFFINGVFYNDARDPKNVNYSEVILKWAAKCKEEGVGEMKTAKMEETQFIDLEIKMGYPYVYQHYGNCEHVFTFSSIHMLSQTDQMCRKDYPFLYRLSHKRYTYCNICGRNEAAFIVRNSQQHIHDPSFLCQNCFKSYHYIDGEKIGKFEAFRFYGNHVMDGMK